ncbi:hypothetical protein Efla_006951 [Eimeria flavescens]
MADASLSSGVRTAACAEQLCEVESQPPVFDVHLLAAAKAWTDAEYYRLLSHELPVAGARRGRQADGTVSEEQLSCLVPSTPKCLPLGSTEAAFASTPMSKPDKAEASLSGAFGEGAAAASCCFPAASLPPSAGGSSAAFLSSRSWEAVNSSPVGGSGEPAEDAAGEGEQTPPFESLENRWKAFWMSRADECLSSHSCSCSSSSGSSSSRSRGSPLQTAAKCQSTPEEGTLIGGEWLKPADSLETTLSDATVKRGCSAACSEATAADEQQTAAAFSARQKRAYSAALTEESESEKLRKLPKVTGVRYQAQRNRFVAEWYDQGKTRMAYFPVKVYGFDEARRLAIECRERVLLSKHQRLSCGNRTPASTRRANEGAPPEAANIARGGVPPTAEEASVLWKPRCVECSFEAAPCSNASAMKEEAVSPSLSVSSPRPKGLLTADASRRARSSSLQERLFLAQASLNVVLIDLLNKCLPSFCANSRDAQDARELVEQLQKQLQSVYSGSELAHLQPYLGFSPDSLKGSGDSTSPADVKMQMQTLMDLLKFAPPTGLCSHI